MRGYFFAESQSTPSRLIASSGPYPLHAYLLCVIRHKLLPTISRHPAPSPETIPGLCLQRPQQEVPLARPSPCDHAALALYCLTRRHKNAHHHPQRRGLRPVFGPTSQPTTLQHIPTFFGKVGALLLLVYPQPRLGLVCTRACPPGGPVPCNPTGLRVTADPGLLRIGHLLTGAVAPSPCSAAAKARRECSTTRPRHRKLGVSAIHISSPWTSGQKDCEHASSPPNQRQLSTPTLKCSDIWCCLRTQYIVQPTAPPLTMTSSLLTISRISSAAMRTDKCQSNKRQHENQLIRHHPAPKRGWRASSRNRGTL